MTSSVGFKIMMANYPPRPLRQTFWILVMAALIVAGSFISLPLAPVPVTLQSFFVLLAGFVLGPSRGALAAVLYLAAGLIGLPVFAGGTSGIAKLTGPTGGFLLSFPLAATFAGFVSEKSSQPLSWRQGLFGGGLASAVPFALGVPWLKLKLGLSWAEASATGFLPFLPGAALKLVLCIATYQLLEKQRLLPWSQNLRLAPFPGTVSSYKGPKGGNRAAQGGECPSSGDRNPG